MTALVRFETKVWCSRWLIAYLSVFYFREANMAVPRKFRASVLITYLSGFLLPRSEHGRSQEIPGIRADHLSQRVVLPPENRTWP